MRTNKYFTKKSKKGFTLVEAICAVFVLAIVFVGVLNAVAFSRQMVLSNNAREKASYKGQLVADEIIATVTGVDPDDAESDPIALIEQVINNLETDPQNTDPENAVGHCTHVDTYANLTSPGDFTYDATAGDVQYTLEAVGETYTDAMDGTVSVQEISQRGWNITVRVFYKEFEAQAEYKCVDITAFAPFNYNS